MYWYGMSKKATVTSNPLSGVLKKSRQVTIKHIFIVCRTKKKLLGITTTISSVSTVPLEKTHCKRKTLSKQYHKGQNNSPDNAVTTRPPWVNTTDCFSNPRTLSTCFLSYLLDKTYCISSRCTSTTQICVGGRSQTQPVQ